MNHKYEDEQKIIENTEEAKKQFGEHCGSQIIKLSIQEIQALLTGKLVAVDVMSEYVVFIELKN